MLKKIRNFISKWIDWINGFGFTLWFIYITALIIPTNNYHYAWLYLLWAGWLLLHSQRIFLRCLMLFHWLTGISIVRCIHHGCALIAIKNITGEDDNRIIRTAWKYGYRAGSGLSNYDIGRVMQDLGYHVYGHSHKYDHDINVGCLRHTCGDYLCTSSKLRHAFTIMNGVLDKIGCDEVNDETVATMILSVEKIVEPSQQQKKLPISALTTKEA